MATKKIWVAGILAIVVLNICTLQVQSAAISPKVEGEEVGQQFRSNLQTMSNTLFNLFTWIANQPLCGILELALNQAFPIKLGCDLPDPVFYNLTGLIPNVNLKGELGILRSSLAFNFKNQTLGVPTATIFYHGDDQPLDVDCGLVLPAIGVQMDYEMRNVIALGIIPLEGKGKLGVSIDGLELTFNKGKLPLVDPIHFDPTTFVFDFYIRKIKLSFTGLFNGNEELSETVSDALSNILFSDIVTFLNTILSTLHPSIAATLMDNLLVAMEVADLEDLYAFIGKVKP